MRDHYIIIIFGSWGKKSNVRKERRPLGTVANVVTVGSLTAKLPLDSEETKKKLVKVLTSLLFRVLLIKPFQVFQASGITGINGCAKSLNTE